MSLQTVITLLMAALVAHSSGFVVKPLRESNTNSLPGFNYTRESNTIRERLSVIAPKGTQDTFVLRLHNTSAWTTLPSDGASVSITQNTTFPLLGVHYDNIKVEIGDAVTEGLLVYAYLGDTVYNLTLVAERADGDSCKLETKLSVKQESVELILFDLQEVDDAFLDPEVEEGLKAAVLKGLGENVTRILVDSFEKQLPETEDTDELCRKILAGQADDFPELDF